LETGLTLTEVVGYLLIVFGAGLALGWIVGYVADVPSKLTRALDFGSGT
jgi:hypothetical protein